MDKRETPPNWQSVMDARGVPSANALAIKSGVAVQTVIRLIHNEGNVTRSSLDKIGSVLKMNPSQLLALRGEGNPWAQPFTLPPEADELDDFERDVVKRMVRALLRARTNAAAETTPEPAEPAVLPRAARRQTRPTTRELLDQEADPS